MRDFLPVLTLFCFLLPYLNPLPVEAQEQCLIDIQRVNPRIKVRSSGCNPCPRIYLLENIARRLGHVQEDLEKKGLGLIVFQGYRPPSVQRTLDRWLSRCLSLPEHYRRGMGVDVAVYYISGQPLQVPTIYGDFSGRACRDNCCWPCHIFHNMSVLENTMGCHGFVPMRENWWHFDARGWKLAPNLCCECIDLECCGCSCCR